MNVRIFWVRAMKCMCAQTRPRFILSSERVFGGMEFEPMLTPREKSPLPENVPRGGSNPRRCGQRAQALPTELLVALVNEGFVVWSELCCCCCCICCHVLLSLMPLAAVAMTAMFSVWKSRGSLFVRLYFDFSSTSKMSSNLSQKNVRLAQYPLQGQDSSDSVTSAIFHVSE